MSNKGENRLCVALPISSFLPAQGGAEVGLHNIALQLMAKGHRPVVITSMAHKRALHRRGWRLPYEVVSYPPRVLTWRETHPALARAILNIFHGFLQWRYSFDVWHTTFGFPIGVSVIEFCRSRGIAHLVRCVGADIQIRHDIGYGMRLNPRVDEEVRRWLPKAQCLIAITESVVDEYKDIGIEDEKITRIPNGIDLKRFKEFQPKNNLREKLGIAEDAIIFLALGRNHPKKNFAQLIDAGVALRKQTTAPFAIIIVGKGVSKLTEHLHSAKAQKLVHLVEPENEQTREDELKFPSDMILEMYFSADAFVMPSLIETFGIVVIEAMAAGLPVIVADSPGCRDVVGEGQFGQMYDGSTDALVNAMTEMLGDIKMRDAFADKSRVRAADFDWAEIVDNYLHTYRRLIAQLGVRASSTRASLQV